MFWQRNAGGMYLCILKHDYMLIANLITIFFLCALCAKLSIRALMCFSSRLNCNSGKGCSCTWA